MRYISNGPLIAWMCPVFGVRGASWFLGVSEWLFGLLLFLGFWSERLGILGALGSCASFIGTVTIIPFMPDGWAASACAFSSKAGPGPVLPKSSLLFPVLFFPLEPPPPAAKQTPEPRRR